MTGWRAECSDCPAVIEPDYGARVFPSEEFEDTDAGRHAAERWAIEHRTANPGHNPTVNPFTRWTMTLVEPIAPAVLEAIFGRPVPESKDGEERRIPEVAQKAGTVRPASREGLLEDEGRADQ